MNGKSLTLTAAVACLLTPLTLPVSAGVYVSYDSLQPTFDQRLSHAMLERMDNQMDAIIQQGDIQEYYAASIIDFQKAQQERIDAKAAQLAAQQFANEQVRLGNHRDANAVMLSRASLEDQRLALEADAKKREAALLGQGIKQERDFLEKQQVIQNQFFNTQAIIQKESIALQQHVALTQDQLLEDQLRDGAPSNMIVASIDASNMKQVVNPNNLDSVKSLGEAHQRNSVVNLNQFVSSVLPANYHYSAPSGLDNETINMVQGKDWRAILNHIAVNNPHLEITVDPYQKTVFIKNTMQYQTSSEVSRTTPYTTWHISTDETMRGNIQRFTDQAKWTLYWDAQDTDYPTIAPAVIKARFAGKGGVIDQMIELTQELDYPLDVDFKYGNKVVIVTLKGAKTK